MTDLEAGPDTNPVVDAVTTETPASETVSSAVPETASTPLEDLYDFGPPGENEPPAAPAAEAVAEVPAAPAAPVISDALLQRASAMGYTPEVIASFKDPIQFEAVIGTAERVAMQAMNFARQQAPAAVQAHPVQAVQLTPPPAAPVFDENAMRMELTAKNFDPGLIDAHVSIAKQGHASALQNHQFALANHQLMTDRLAAQDRYNAESQQYMQGQAQAFQAIQAQHQRELIDRDYTAFKSGLPEPVQKLVDTPEARAQIMQTANVLLMGLHASGQQLPSNTAAFKQAMYAALGEKIHQTSVETVRAEVKTHQARATTRPSASSGGAQAGKLPFGPDRAGAWIESFYKQNGMPSSSGGIEV